MVNQYTKFLVTASQSPHLNQVTWFLLKILFFVQNDVFPLAAHMYTQLFTTPSNGNIFVSLFKCVISTLEVSLYTYIVLCLPQLTFNLSNTLWPWCL